MAKIEKSRRSVFAKNIIDRRKRLRLSQSDLASIVGVHRNTIADIERGVSEGQPDTRQAIATALGCAVSELFGSKPSSVFSFDEGVLIVRSFQSSTPDIQAAVRHLLGLDPADFAYDVLEQAEAYLQQEASAKLKTSKR